MTKFVEDYRKTPQKPKDESKRKKTTACKREIFCKGDSNKWWKILFTTTETFDDTVPSYR